MKTLHKPIHEKCMGCLMIIKIGGEKTWKCSCYINPSYWWEYGRKCPIATHLSGKTDGATKKNPTKLLPPVVPKSKDWPKSGIKTPKRFSYRKGRE